MFYIAILTNLWFGFCCRIRGLQDPVNDDEPVTKGWYDDQYLIQRNSIPDGETAAVNEDEEMIISGDFEINGDLDLDGNLYVV